VDAFLTLLRYAGDQYVQNADVTFTLEQFVAATAIDPVIAKRPLQIRGGPTEDDSCEVDLMPA